VETSGVGGTHPALLEAMGFGNCVVTHDTPENLETVRNAGFSYDGKEGAASLCRVLAHLLENPQVVEERRAMSLAHVRANYSWDKITDQYLELFGQVLRGKKTRRRR
jgi:glycosyltransferase involved in cell wall biosynthesis